MLFPGIAGSDYSGGDRGRPKQSLSVRPLPRTCRVLSHSLGLIIWPDMSGTCPNPRTAPVRGDAREGARATALSKWPFGPYLYRPVRTDNKRRDPEAQNLKLEPQIPGGGSLKEETYSFSFQTTRPEDRLLMKAGRYDYDRFRLSRPEKLHSSRTHRTFCEGCADQF